MFHGPDHVQVMVLSSCGNPAPGIGRSSGVSFCEGRRGEYEVNKQPTEHILQYFNCAHLPDHLQKVSAPFAQLATILVAELPRNSQRSVALRKLLEAQKAAVHASERLPSF